VYKRQEQNYYDAELCYQEWQSCQSCHPLTRPDALNWILSSGATGTPKNARSMLYAWWTPPTNWTGKRDNAQQSIIYGISSELFQTPSDEMTVPMDTFFMYLKPVPSPFLEKGRLSASAQRGRALYYNKTKVDCIDCHKGPMFMDEKLYYTGIPDIFDPSPINTPHLTETWRTAPYGHLGTYTGMREILEVNTHSNMSKNMVSGILTMNDVNDLVEYVNSL
jgi:cytochrome c peroxidase